MREEEREGGIKPRTGEQRRKAVKSYKKCGCHCVI